ncbi:hypothetical protein [Staphylococcus xylosus]|uniref:hypothetical protein n=1 Tax=Staphylococcus xylosus TaxID=1288 RepID=UPI00298EEBFD|nr:hypothetical protein [Staphylococcus xylosus]MDW8555060.1 hypothetical protein [Staphylococcus xylosus]
MKKVIISLISLILIVVIGLVFYTKMFKIEKPLYTKINTQQIEKMKNEKKISPFIFIKKIALGASV